MAKKKEKPLQVDMDFEELLRLAATSPKKKPQEKPTTPPLKKSKKKNK